MAENRVAQALAEVAYNPDPENKVAQAMIEVAYRDSLNVDEYSGWEYAHAGYVVTPWVSLNMLDVSKYFKSVEHFVEHAETNTNLKVDYRVDSEESWTNVGSVTTTPSEENSLYVSSYVTGKRIQFRYRFYTEDAEKTVDIQSWLLESIPSIPQKTAYSCRVRLEDNAITLFGKRSYNTISEAYSALESFVSSPEPVTIDHANADIYESKEVKLTGLTADPIVDYEGKEVMIATLTFIET